MGFRNRLMTRFKTVRRLNSISFSWVTKWMAITGACLVAQLIHVPESQAQPELAGGLPGTTAPAVHLIEVPLPISGMVDTQIKRQIDQFLSQQSTSEKRPILILEFSSQADQASQYSEFERCLSLARFLTSDQLGGTRTVAFVVGNLTGHAVLPVLACEELIVSPDAEIGDAGVTESFIDRTMKSSYVEISEHRRTIEPAVAVGMIDQQATVLQVQTGDGVHYILQEELATLKQSTTVSNVVTIVATGDMARFTGRELRQKYHFASHLAADRGELAAALQIPISALQDDSLLDGPRDALRVDITRPISGKLVNWIIASINQSLANHSFNFICINIDSPGGSASDSLRLANYLVSLSSEDIRTVAFVRDEARADASLIALACNQLVIGRDAILGGPGAVVIRKHDLPDVRRSIRALAESRHYDWSLSVALVDSSLVVHRYIRQGTNEIRYFCPEELAAQDAPEEWKQDAEILAGHGLSGSEAVETHLATQTADSLDEFRRLYELEGELRVVQPNWANLLIERLASPHLAGTILFIGLMMFMIEMSQPGIGVAGFVSAVCFVLFFWSNVLHGTAGWLEIMLFLTGIGCLVLEIFVIPGFGVFGIGGSAMVVGSIILASQTFVIPQNKYQLEQLPQSLFVLVAAGSGAFFSMFVLRKYLSDIPILRHMLLAPVEDEELEELQQREAIVHCGHLAGKRGTTTTRLNPAGKARFGDEVVDVIGEGELIERGTDVSVASVQGSRIVVVPIANSAEARPA
jgi:membrane-bound ClpP family serine protease